MPFTLTMPKLSPTMEEGTLVKWHKKEGEFVKAGDTLFEIATDKATVEHNALDAGFLRKILVQEGSVAIVNEALAIFTEQEHESIEGYQPQGEKRKSRPVATDTVQESTASERSEPVPVQKGGMQQPVFIPEPPVASYTFSGVEGELEGRVVASPLAKKIAKEKGIDLTTVKGSGPHGRIVVEDLAMGQPDAVATFGRRAIPSLPPGSYEEEPLSVMRKVIAQRLQESKTFIPHFYVSQEVNMGALFTMRKDLTSHGIKLSFNDFIVRAAALALKTHPEINSGFHSVNNTLIRFKTIDIAVAVSVPTGLITPIVRHADYKHVGQIAQEISTLR